MGIDSVALSEQLLVWMPLLDIVISTLCSIVAVAAYVLAAIGVYTIAKRRNIKNPWMAWIPYANFWILGSISDQYQDRVKGKKTARRKWLLGLAIATGVMAVVILFLSLGALLLLIVPFLVGISQELVSLVALLTSVGSLVLCLPLVAVAIVSIVIQYMVLFDLYRSSKPNSAVLFLVLSILLGDLYAIFVFLCRNSDEGMPVELLEE